MPPGVTALSWGCSTLQKLLTCHLIPFPDSSGARNSGRALWRSCAPAREKGGVRFSLMTLGEQLEQEPLLPAWCATRGIECVRMLGWTLRLSHSRRNTRTRKGRQR